VIVDNLPIETSQRKVQLKELSPKHKMVAALLAQGLDRVVVAQSTDLTPEYITWLGGDTLFKGYVKEMSALAGVHLEALFSKSVDIIAEQMLQGSGEDKLKAARLQMEATGRLGKNPRQEEDESGSDRLEQLAQRLVALQRKYQPSLIEGTATVVPEGA